MSQIQLERTLLLGWGPNVGSGSLLAFVDGIDVVHQEMVSLQSRCQPVVMAEMPPLYSPLMM